LSCLMGAGIVAMVAGIVKTILYGRYSTNFDFFYGLAPTGVWLYVLDSKVIRQCSLTDIDSQLELFIGSIACCVPCLKALSEQLFKKMGVTLSSARGTTHKSGNSASYGLKNYGSQQSTASSARKPFNIEDAVWDGTRPRTTVQVLSPGEHSPPPDGKNIIVRDESVYWESASANT